MIPALLNHFSIYYKLPFVGLTAKYPATSNEHPQVTFFWTQLEAIVATDAKLGCEFRYRVCGNLI